MNELKSLMGNGTNYGICRLSLKNLSSIYNGFENLIEGFITILYLYSLQNTPSRFSRTRSVSAILLRVACHSTMTIYECLQESDIT